MGQFASEQEVYDDLGRQLTNAAADEDVSARLRQSDTVVQYRVMDPSATLTIDVRAKSGVKVELGETKLEPEIVLSLQAETAQRLFAGEIALVEALAEGDIASKGPVAKILKVLPLMGSVSGAPAAGSTEQRGPDTPDPAPADEAPAPQAAEDPQADAAPAVESAPVEDPAPTDEAPAEES